MGDRLLRRQDVEIETGLSRSTIYRKMKDGTFPLPRRAGENSVRWPASEIDNWKRGLPLHDASP